MTRVAATGDGAIAVSGSPITTSGTFALSLASTAVTAGKTHIFIFVTDDGGTRWRGAALVDYVN